MFEKVPLASSKLDLFAGLVCYRIECGVRTVRRLANEELFRWYLFAVFSRSFLRRVNFVRRTALMHRRRRTGWLYEKLAKTQRALLRSCAADDRAKNQFDRSIHRYDTNHVASQFRVESSIFILYAIYKKKTTQSEL